MTQQTTESNQEAVTEETVTPQLIEATVRMAKARYVGALNYFVQRTKNKAVSKRNVLRALTSAIDMGVTDSKIDFKTKDEAELAGLLAQIIDLSMIIKADNLKNKEKENGSTKSSTVEESK